MVWMIFVSIFCAACTRTRRQPFLAFLSECTGTRCQSRTHAPAWSREWRGERMSDESSSVQSKVHVQALNALRLIMEVESRSLFSLYICIEAPTPVHYLGAPFFDPNLKRNELRSSNHFRSSDFYILADFTQTQDAVPLCLPILGLGNCHHGLVTDDKMRKLTHGL